MGAKELMRLIHQPIERVLKLHGLGRKGNNYSGQRNDVVLLVQLQKSDASTAEKLILTVNLGIFSRPLAKKLGYDISSPTVPDCHWRERIGFLLPVQDDKWWTVTADKDAIRVGEELANALSTYGIPTMNNLDSSAKLRDLWSSGQCPGLTEGQRKDYLKTLTAINSS